MTGDLSYNANNLQTFDRITRLGIITNKIRHTDMPNIAGDAVAIADADDSEVPSANYPNKIITLAGSIHGSSQTDLDNRVDAFKAIFTQRYKNLDIAYGGSTRRYIAMKANAVGVDRNDRAYFATFNVELICKPFGREIAATTLLNAVGSTAAVLTTPVTVGGTAPYQQLKFTFTITAKTGTGDYIQITNDQTGQIMLIAGKGLKAGDVLVIDAENHKVTLNTVEVDYSGTFLELEPGARSFTITDGFATRTMTILIEYNKRYV